MQKVKDWNKGTHDFGTHPPGVELKTTFEYTGDLAIESFRTSCGCTSASMNNRVFTIGYKTKPVKDSLKAAGIHEQEVKQTLFVNFADDSQTQLHIKVTIKE